MGGGGSVLRKANGVVDGKDKDGNGIHPLLFDQVNKDDDKFADSSMDDPVSQDKYCVRGVNETLTRRRSSIKIQPAQARIGGDNKERKISFVLKRDSSHADAEGVLYPNHVHEELSDTAKLEVLRFATEISLNTDLAAILKSVDKNFSRLFSTKNVIIHLNPEYASRYNRFLRKHSSCVDQGSDESLTQSILPNKNLVSRLEIGFEEYLTRLCGLRSLQSSLSSHCEQGPMKLKTHEDDKGPESDMMTLGCPIFSLVNSNHTLLDNNESISSNKSGLESSKYTNNNNNNNDAKVQNKKKRNIIAVCEVRKPDGLEQFTEDEATLLSALCIHLGQALERACIESDLSKHLEWSRVMLKMSETLNSKLDAVLLIESAIKMLREALFAERGSMYLVDDTKTPPDLWTMVTGSNTDCEALRELRIPFGKGIAGYVAASEKVVVISDAYKDKRFNPEVDKRTGLKTTSILCLPVFSSKGLQKGKLVAVIQMINKKDTEGGWTAPFDQDDVDLLNSFSSHVSVALNNAKVTAKNKYNEEIANNLLDKMFPKHITEKLKSSNEQAEFLKLATSKNKATSNSQLCHQPIVEKYDRVFVFFSDIVSFTTLSRTWEPYEVVNLLNDLFTQLDFLSEKHHVYKLETIGDAYVACSNLPFMDQNSEREAAENMARFAAEATDYVNNKFITRNGKRIQIRSGVHCGPCFGGVVGLRMPRYCLMGDTMNTASRMESTGTPGKVHISQDFKDALQVEIGKTPYFAKYEFEDLGMMEVKGKGQMRTYFLEAPEFLIKTGYKRELSKIANITSSEIQEVEEQQEEKKEQE